MTVEMHSAALQPERYSPLSGIRVIEFSHMVMGPSCGMVLADLGADVIKVEPAPNGDNTRRLTGAAVGFFAAFNRNKRSLCVDMKNPAGQALVKSLIQKSDVFLENFRPGAMERLGLDNHAVSELNPRIIYCACKGFLPGPYENRIALDEVVQMMGGLAYMTGPPGRPLRAGSSVNDITGGIFGAVAILAALHERERTGKGSYVQSGLFETNMVFMAQHMARAAIEGRNPEPFGDPAMAKPWPVYDVFETNQPNAQVFVGAVTDSQWSSLCNAFHLHDLLNDPALATSEARAKGRPRILAKVREVFGAMTKAELLSKLEELGLPFAPIAQPADLFEDPHLLASNGLVATDLTVAEGAPGGHPSKTVANIPSLPLASSHGRPSLRHQPPKLGEHNVEAALLAGLSPEEIRELFANGVLVGPSQESAVRNDVAPA